jgi:hypothetical protein
MRWPFRTRGQQEIRIFRDAKTDKLNLRVVGPLSLPSIANPIITFCTTLEYELDDMAATRLLRELQHFIKTD